MTTCCLFGAFDMLNVRHTTALEQLRERYGVIVLAVFDDLQVEHLNGRPPVVPAIERMALVQHVRGVDQVVNYGTGPVPQGATLLAIVGERVPAELAVSWIEPDRETAAEAVIKAIAPATTMVA